jgi:hypothetical protein
MRPKQLTETMRPKQLIDKQFAETTNIPTHPLCARMLVLARWRFLFHQPH